MEEKIQRIIRTYLDGSDDSYDWTTEELLKLFDVSKPLASKEVKNCMKADLKCGSVCK